MDARDLLCYWSISCAGDQSAMMRAIRQKKEATPEEVESNVRRIKSKWVTLLDDDYPDALKKMPMPPLVLFYRGDYSLISDYTRCVSIVGSREATSYALKKAEELARGAADKGYSVISGLAKGVDTAVANGAFPYGRAVAVLGNGLGRVYPPENEALQRMIGQKGLLISEYPDDVGPAPYQFPARNRIIAGLSKATILAEAKLHSGSMITCALALELNRDVGAVPFRADEDSACNVIIKEGAALIESVDDLLLLLEGSERFYK